MGNNHEEVKTGSIEVKFDIGDDVKIAKGDIVGEIIGICFRDLGYTEYQVAWWTNGDRKTAWLMEFEVGRL